MRNKRVNVGFESASSKIVSGHVLFLCVLMSPEHGRDKYKCAVAAKILHQTLQASFAIFAKSTIPYR